MQGTDEKKKMSGPKSPQNGPGKGSSISTRILNTKSAKRQSAGAFDLFLIPPEHNTVPDQRRLSNWQWCHKSRRHVSVWRFGSGVLLDPNRAFCLGFFTSQTKPVNQNVVRLSVPIPSCRNPSSFAADSNDLVPRGSKLCSSVRSFVSGGKLTQAKNQ